MKKSFGRITESLIAQVKGREDSKVGYVAYIVVEAQLRVLVLRRKILQNVFYFLDKF